MTLDEFIALLEKERKKSGQQNPFVNIGGQNKNKGTVIGNYEISIEESMSDRMKNEIFIIAKSY